MGPIIKFFVGGDDCLTLLPRSDVAATLAFVLIHDLRAREDGNLGGLINLSQCDLFGRSSGLPSCRLQEVHLFSRLHELFIPAVFLRAILHSVEVFVPLKGQSVDFIRLCPRILKLSFETPFLWWSLHSLRASINILHSIILGGRADLILPPLGTRMLTGSGQEAPPLLEVVVNCLAGCPPSSE